MHVRARGRSQDLAMSNSDMTVHTVNKDTEEIKQSVHSAQARRQSEKLLRQRERERQLRQQAAPEQQQQRLQAR